MLQVLELYKFRNVDAQRVEFSPDFNALIGANGQGKTNVLEAVYYLSLLRSFRTAQINDLRQWKTPTFRLAGHCQWDEMPATDLEVVYGDERRLTINGNHVYRTSEFINQFICITFIPQDMELIRGSEALRRRFLDIAITQLSPSYLRHLQDYNAALKARNELLRQDGRHTQKVMAAYDEVLVRCGVQVELERREFTRQLNEQLEQSSESLMDGEKHLSLKYLSGMGTVTNAPTTQAEDLVQIFHEALEHSYERDCRDGYTHPGPHRAEFACLLNGASLKHFGSEGECRMASLAVKFACLDIVRQQVSQDKVTLLVDDVIGELDDSRQRKFFAKLNQAGQIIMAGTAIPPTLQQQPRVMTVRNGVITEQA